MNTILQSPLCGPAAFRETGRPTHTPSIKRWGGPACAALIFHLGLWGLWQTMPSPAPVSQEPEPVSVFWVPPPLSAPTPPPPEPKAAPPKAETPVKPAPRPTPQPMRAPSKQPVLPSERTQETLPAPSAPMASPPEPVAAAPVPPAPPPAPVTPPRFDAAYLNNPAPAYPAISRRLQESGKVMLRVHVSREGVADQVMVKTSSGFPRLDEAAEAAVKKWRFTPAKQGEEALDGWVLVPIVFNLQE